MKVEQIYGLVNDITEEILGKNDLIKEDLSNTVDVGTEIFNADAVDNYVKSLIDHIGKVVFVNRKYNGVAPSVLMDSWEFGSVLEKITAELPVAEENESWNLNDGEVYEQDIFYQPKVSAKFYNSKVTFEIPMSFTSIQVKESFSNATQLNAFFSMIETAIEKSLTIKLDSLIMRTINNMIAETVNDEYGSADLNTKSGVRAVNLLYLYNREKGTSLTPEKAYIDPDFVRFASMKMAVISSRLTRPSTLFNIGGTDKFTPRDLQHFILLADFEKSAETYLYSDTFHDDYVKLPNAENVPYWQASGKTFDFSDISKIDVKTSTNKDVEVSGILGVLFDRDALGVANMNKRVTSHYNAKGEFYSNWYKTDASFYNDTNENFVVFFVA